MMSRAGSNPLTVRPPLSRGGATRRRGRTHGAAVNISERDCAPVRGATWRGRPSGLAKDSEIAPASRPEGAQAAVGTRLVRDAGSRGSGRVAGDVGLVGGQNRERSAAADLHESAPGLAKGNESDGLASHPDIEGSKRRGRPSSGDGASGSIGEVANGEREKGPGEIRPGPIFAEPLLSGIPKCRSHSRFTARVPTRSTCQTHHQSQGGLGSVCARSFAPEGPGTQGGCAVSSDRPKRCSEPPLPCASARHRTNTSGRRIPAS